MKEDKQRPWLDEEYGEEIDWKPLFGGATLIFFIAWAILRMNPMGN